jgi:hypothetical protein
VLDTVFTMPVGAGALTASTGEENVVLNEAAAAAAASSWACAASWAWPESADGSIVVVPAAD